MATPRTPPLVWSPHTHSGKEQLCELDICRCRKNALLHCPYEIPVLRHFDNLVPTRPGHLADFNFVKLTGRGRCSALSLLPYIGPMFYHRVAVEHTLHHGLCNWSDIKWQLSAETGRLPPDTLKEPLQIIEQAWGKRSTWRSTVSTA